jgi:thymidylate kinase
MIVEFTGSSGVGKTTLISEVVRQCREREIPAFTVPEVLLRSMPEMIVGHRTLQNLMLDTTSAFRRIADPAPYRAFLAFAHSVIRRETDRIFTGLNAYRGVLRALGVHAALSHHTKRIILVDEGTVHQAHNVLVHVARPARSEDIRTFGSLVPLPDLVVYLTAPLSVVLARTRGREHPPLWNRSRDDNGRFVQHGYAMFGELMSHEAFSPIIMRIHCDEDDRKQHRARAREVVERIA